MKKQLLVGCGIVGILGIGLFVALGLFIVGGAFALTRPVVDASEQFLTLLGQGKISEAYARAADGFRAQQDEASFTSAAHQFGLTDYASVSWHNRQIEKQLGKAEGTVTTKAGDKKPISIRLVWEGDKWAILGVQYGGVELATTQIQPPVPGQAQLNQMAAEALLAFNKAVRARNFTPFYGTLSDVWQKQTTPEKLQTAFQPFIDKDIDIGPIKDLKPRIAAPIRVNDQGILTVAGLYPTRPSRVRFELEYTRECGGWKLMGISVHVAKARALEL